MSATLSKLRTSWVGRALLAYAVSALALVVLGLAAPGSAVFFPLVSLWCNLALFGLVLVVLRLADVKFDLFHWAEMEADRGRLSSGPGGRLPFHSGLSG